MHRKALKKDGGIPEYLKEIIEILTSNYSNYFRIDRSLKRVE
jgi:hypothetical protein